MIETKERGAETQTSTMIVNEDAKLLKVIWTLKRKPECIQKQIRQAHSINSDYIKIIIAVLGI